MACKCLGPLGGGGLGPPLPPQTPGTPGKGQGPWGRAWTPGVPGGAVGCAGGKVEGGAALGRRGPPPPVSPLPGRRSFWGGGGKGGAAASRECRCLGPAGGGTQAFGTPPGMAGDPWPGPGALRGRDVAEAAGTGDAGVPGGCHGYGGSRVKGQGGVSGSGVTPALSLLPPPAPQPPGRLLATVLRGEEADLAAAVEAAAVAAAKWGRLGGPQRAQHLQR